MTRFAAASVFLACFATILPVNAPQAQTLDVITLTDEQGASVDVTITRDAEHSEQVLASGGTELARAPSLVSDLMLTDTEGNTVGAILYVGVEDQACPAEPHALTLAFGTPWLDGPIGEPCMAYAAATYPGGAMLFSQPQLHRDGDAVLFDLEQGAHRLGPISYAPQNGRGWDALDAEVGGYSELSPLDLYAAEPVYDGIHAMWGDELNAFAQHLASRTIPQIEGGFLLQTGCLPGQCAFAIGMLAVDPAREAIYSAYFNEGAPASRPDLAEWPPEARAIYDRWREGDFR